MTSSDKHAIVVDHLSKRHEDLLAVDDVSFAVHADEAFAFLGPDGAGKSTPVEMIETIRRPTSGTITLLTLQSAGVLAAFAAAGFLVGTVLTRWGE